MATTAFGASKAHGVICVHPDCFTIMRTQKFKSHFQARHLSPGQRYETRHRDEFERALLDPDLLDLADDGPLKALMVASVVRIAHYLDVLAARLPPQDGEDGEETTNNGSWQRR
ncbi:hypothetical protein PINS_up011666 [Pythium insidiosum]|nr:hypothetical protein PINS_up011666 [Pythium insidiosum]